MSTSTLARSGTANEPTTAPPADGYGRPVSQYIGVLAVYAAAVAAIAAVTKRRGRPLPRRIEPYDLIVTALATQQASRRLTKEKVTAPLRAPFAEYTGPAGAGQVNEKSRGGAVRRTIGELVSCPFCMSQWVATAFVAGLVIAPRPTRLASALFASLSIADMAQLARTMAEQRAERE